MRGEIEGTGIPGEKMEINCFLIGYNKHIDDRKTKTGGSE